MKLLLLQYVFIADKINKKSKQCIATARGCIPECLQGHQPVERRIKEINNGQDKISYCIKMPFHAGLKNITLLVILNPSAPESPEARDGFRKFAAKL